MVKFIPTTPSPSYSALALWLGDKLSFMRRLYTFLLLSSLCAASTTAQDNGTGFTGNGYYRIRNYATQRYIYVTDDKDYYDATHDKEDFQAVQLWSGAERAAASPASVIYIINTNGNNYDLTAQGTGIHALTGRYVSVSKKSDGTYEVSASAQGVTKYLSDDEQSDDEQGMMGTTGKGFYRRWIVDKIETNHATNYVGIAPTIHVGDKHYQPYYASYPFKAVSPDMHIYYVRKISGSEVVLKEIEGEIPGSMPVIIECASANPSDNRIELLSASSAQAPANQLDGVYFCNGSRPRQSVNAYKIFDAETMRVFTESDGKLIATDNAEDRLTLTRVFNPANPSSSTKIRMYCIPANTSYLKANASTAAVLGVRFEGIGIDDIIADKKDQSAEGVYTMSGTQLRKSNDMQGLPAGLYIVGGVKVAVK